ncbi:hypothetical protein GBA52_013398 [Prunus armeniaca]|nr:hypothetical protein GBA52_013398 [Prunus armeniaca]
MYLPLDRLNLYFSCILALLEESAEVDLFSSLKNFLNLYLSCILALLEESAEVDLFSSLKNLFEKKWAFHRTLALMAVGVALCDSMDEQERKENEEQINISV